MVFYGINGTWRIVFTATGSTVVLLQCSNSCTGYNHGLFFYQPYCQHGWCWYTYYNFAFCSEHIPSSIYGSDLYNLIGPGYLINSKSGVITALAVLCVLGLT